MKRVWKAAVAAAVSVSMLTGTAYAATDKVAGQKWIDTDIDGNVTANTPVNPRDDFYLAVNKNWINSAAMRESQTEVSGFTEQEDTVRMQIQDLIQNGSNTSHEASLVKQLYSDSVDMASRNADGIEPARKYVEEILAIDSMDQLSAYLTDPDKPFNSTLIGFSPLADFEDSTKYAVYLGGCGLSLGDADEYQNMTDLGKRTKAADKKKFIKFYGLFGMTESEAAARYDAMFDLETQLAPVSYGTSVTKKADYFQKIYNPAPLSDIIAAAPDYPVADSVKLFTDKGISNFIFTNPAYFAKLNELYTADNLEKIKDYELYHLMSSAIYSLDQRCMDMADEALSTIYGTAYKSDVAEDAYNNCSSLLPWAVGKMYVEGCVDPRAKSDVTEIIQDTIATYRTRLQNNTWLSDETKARAIEKLDNLTVRAAYPDDWTPYECPELNFTAREDGGNLLQDTAAIILYSINKSVDDASKPVDKTRWSETPQTINAGYSFMDNSINIPAGILGNDFYNADAGEAANMGGIGMIIGHEISHGFDPKGSQFDKDGNMADWWTDADRAAFNDRAKKVIDYWSAFEPISGIHVDGDLTKGETIADLGGMMCMLEIAKAKENFDYNAFFTQFAKVWKQKSTAGEEESLIRTDPHPPLYLRTNATVQQFQEFYDTFGVKEGDAMYLAPEQRLSVW